MKKFLLSICVAILITLSVPTSLNEIIGTGTVQAASKMRLSKKTVKLKVGKDSKNRGYKVNKHYN